MLFGDEQRKSIGECFQKSSDSFRTSIRFPTDTLTGTDPRKGQKWHTTLGHYSSRRP